MKSITTVILDFSRVLLFSQDENYAGKLNPLHDTLSESTEYQFSDNFVWNEALLNFCEKNKEKYNLFVFTAGEAIQAVREVKEKLGPIFKRVYFASEFGFAKSDPEAYAALAKSLQEQPGNILFIDDAIENIQAAQSAGLQTLRFQLNEQFFKDIGGVLHEK